MDKALSAARNRYETALVDRRGIHTLSTFPSDSASQHPNDRACEPAPNSLRTRTAQQRADSWFLIVITIFAIPLIIAAASDAALTWDGAYYLFRTLDTGKPFIAHDRLIDAPIHWPVLWVNALTDSLTILRATFGVVHVVTPLVALAFSWWVVRKEAPALIIWPLLGIGLATLPGQLNFISEGIKAHHLMWPVLLAVLIGLPARTIPMVAMLSLLIMYLHPAAVPILGAVAAVAFVMGTLHPGNRERLYPLAGCLAIASLLRYGMITGGYQTGEMNIETMKRQWLNSATGLPGISPILAFAAAIVLLGAALLKSTPRLLQVMPMALVALAGAALAFWAAEPARWWDALEFRGPASIVSLTMAGFASLDGILATGMKRDRLHALPDIRRWTGQTIAVTFALVLSIQSITYGRVIDDMNVALAASEAQCLAVSDLPGMPESPLNHWATPSLSLLYQGWKPSRIVLPDGGCELALKDGRLPIASTGAAYRSDRIDLLPLQWELGGHGACWWDEPSGWHAAEAGEIGRRRWSPDTGVIRVLVGEPVTVSFRGTITTHQAPNSVDVIVNGERQQTIEFTSAQEMSLDGLSLQLRKGENVIEFVSANESTRAPGDPRDLAFSFLNVEPVLPASAGSCLYRR
jgi:hypothetical protein